MIWKRMRHQLKGFLGAREGNFAIMTSIALVPAFMAVGIAVDYTAMLTTKSTLQLALDSAALAAASAKNKTDSQRIQIAKDVFSVNITNAGIEVDADFRIENSSVVGDVTYSYNPYFKLFYGSGDMDIGVSDKVVFSPQKTFEVVMVLDYSSSMNTKNKWQTMREAALDLVNILSENGTRNNVSFGLVPFAKAVRLSMPSDYVVGEAPGNNWTGCTQDRKWPHNTDDQVPVSNDDNTKWGLLPTAAGSCNHLDQRNLNVLPLTNQHSTVINQLGNMTPYNGTHIAVGLEFGFHLISPTAPFTNAAAYGTSNLEKFIILLTDGRQTTKSWGPGESHSASNGEDNIEDLCENIKDEDISVFTIAFDLSENSTKQRLRDCATSPDHFFEASSNEELRTSFRDISSLIEGRIYVSR